MNIVEMFRALRVDPRNLIATHELGDAVIDGWGVVHWRGSEESICIEERTLEGWTVKQKPLEVGTEVLIPAKINHVNENGSYQLETNCFFLGRVQQVYNDYNRDQFILKKDVQ